MNIYVINLARRTDRWHFWEVAARKWNIQPYERWEAVDAHELILTPELKHLFRNNIFHYRKPIMACALSHIQIWRHIIEQGSPQTIIFEDDGIFFSQPFEVPELPEGWDLFYFGGRDPHGVEIPGIKVKEHIVIPKLPEKIVFFTYCYMISLEGAKKLIARLDSVGIQDPIDWFMKKSFNEVKVYCYSPLRVYACPELGSDIQL